MDEMVILDKLMEFGMTRQEACIYLCLYKNGELTGYEAAKQTGISRSNVYAGLSELVAIGAAYLIEGNVSKYLAVRIEEFCDNKLRILREEKEFLISSMPAMIKQSEGYITITGAANIKNKIISMLLKAEQRIYLSAPEKFIQGISFELLEAIRQHIKLVLITDKDSGIKEALHYITDKKENQIRLIIDSQYVLTGDIEGQKTDTCLYSGQINFVNVFKEAMRNEMKLIQLTRGENVKGMDIKMSKNTFVTKEMIEKITREYPTPFHIYDEEGIRQNAQAVKEAFSWNKGFREYFAVKANSNPCLIQILRDYGFGCDCSSMTELMLSRAMGVKGEDIMFSSNDTPAEEYAYADKIGAVINLDDITHIDFVENILGKLPETLSCRFNPGGVFKMSNGIMDSPGDAKYGFTTEQMFEGFRILKEKGVKYFGIHSFLASNTVTNEYYPMLAAQLFELAVQLKKETGAEIKFINLSGGIGIPYHPGQQGNDIRIIGEGVRKAFESVLVPAGMGDIAIYTEMGRFMLGPYGALITKAIHEKHTHKEYIGVDACAVNLMRPAMYGAYHHITVLGKEDAPCTYKYDVTGSLCENNDKFATDRMLPEIQKGDYLVIHDTGAHGYAMGYSYNGKLKSAELLLRENGEVNLIRRAETPEDYFATLDGLDIYKNLEEEFRAQF